jgi:photosystem II stability/assembly factor-like uncharacterized protein
MKHFDNARTWIVTLLAIGLVFAAGCNKKTTVEPKPSLVVTPGSIVRTAPYGGPSPSQVYVKVTSTGAPLDFSFSQSARWMSLLSPSGTGTGTTPDSFIVEFHVVDPQDTLAVGTISDSIQISASGAGNSPRYLKVDMTIGTEVKLSPSHLKFTAVQGGPNPSPQQLMINTSSGVPFVYQVDRKPSWAVLSDMSGSAPDTATVSADISGLATGSYVDTIAISSDEVLNSPQFVVCSLSVSPWQTQPLMFVARPSWQDVFFSDALHGWVVGLVAAGNGVQTGVIARTDNGGTSWIQDTVLPTDAQQNSLLSAVRFAGDKGWIVGDNGIILYSDDAGATWQNQSTGLADTVIRLTDIYLYDADTGWITGDNGLVLKTTNGGASWVRKTTPTTSRLYGLSFVDAEHGWAVGNGSTIMSTSNGGESWTLETGGSYDYKDVIFVDQNHGWAVGKEGTVIRTFNGGGFWTSPLPTHVTTGLTSVFFANDSTGWAAGEGGTIIYTTDGGLTWIKQYSDTQNPLFALFFLDERVGWAVGYDGTIRYTNSGGQ